MGDAVIIPRWEWRTFGTRFAPAEEFLARLTPTGIHESDEIYFLSFQGGTVKVRDGLVDIKLLREVGRYGLERWEPVRKAGFPLSIDDVTAIFSALRQPAPDLVRAEYTRDQLLTELVAPHDGIRAVPVHKRRVRYTIEGCTGELTDVEAGGWLTRTIAIESEDPDAVAAGVRAMGLVNRLNTSYPWGLGALCNGEPARYATLDVGTNSVKFCVGRPVEDGGWHVLVDRAEVTQLGEGLADEGRISPAAIGRTTAAIRGMADEARAHLVREIAAVGTAGLRMAGNQAEVLARIAEETGIFVKVISGDEESRLAYLAAQTGLGWGKTEGKGAVVVFDTGGGSSQFSFGHGSDVDERFSVNVGAARYTERFGLHDEVSRNVVEAALAAIAADLHRLDGRQAPQALVGMGGAITNIAAVKLGLEHYDPDAVQGFTLERAEVDRQIELYRSCDAASRRSIAGLQSGRAALILAGACIVRTVMDKLGQNRLTVSARGLRHGLLSERFGAGAVP